MPKCIICGFESIDISQHLISKHSMKVFTYKEKYQMQVVDESVILKRKQTKLDRYGDENYLNREAIKLSNEIYEGGHSLSDPTIRKKAEKTKNERYGDPHFTNREKAKRTCKEKYGVENVAKLKEVKDKKNRTLLERYGKIFNYEPKPLTTKENLIQLHIVERKSLVEIGNIFNVTSAAISYWMKKYEIKITKKISIPKDKEIIPPHKTVEEYLNTCYKLDKILSFSEFGSVTEDKKNQRMKRLFNKGRSLNHLKEELRLVALNPDLWDDFLYKVKNKNKGDS